MDYMLLGKRIRRERLLLHWTLEVLAERTDKSINFIGQIERGEGIPSVETLVDIANALGTTVDNLLQDNVQCDDSTAKEIDALLQTMDDHGKQFLLDMIRRYVYYHKDENRAPQ